METSLRFMSLLTELSGREMDFAIDMSRLTALPIRRCASPAFQQCQAIFQTHGVASLATTPA